MRRICQYFIITLTLQFVALLCHGQYYFRHYQVDNGLVHNSVTSIIQDSKGFIWIGTRAGLNRFDGVTFKTYLNKNNKFESIQDNIITDLAEDKNGKIWIGTAKGVFAFDPYRERLTDIQLVPKGYINDLLIDQDNNLWFIAGQTLYKYDQQTKKTEKKPIKASAIAGAARGILWIGDRHGKISQYNIKTKSVLSINVFDKGTPGDLRSISKIYPISSDQALVGLFSQGLKLCNIKTGHVQTIPLKKEGSSSIYVRDIKAGATGKYWIATESGIYIYDRTSDSSIHLQKRAGDRYSIADNAVYALCLDNQQGMWVGNYFSGLQYYCTQNARFKKYYPIPNANSISGEAVRQITPDSHGNLWIGTEDAGINKFNLSTKKFTHYAATKKPGELSYHNIHGLLAVGPRLFIGPFYHGMEIMDMASGRITDKYNLIAASGGPSSNFISSFYLTRDSTLLVGTSFQGAGLFSFNIRQGRFKQISQIPPNSYVLDIFEDHLGNIWTGSVSRGAFYYNPKTGKRGNIHFGEKVNGKIVNEYTVLDIFEDSEQTLWFATVGGGLIQLNKNGKTFKRFTTKNGLLSNVVYSILEDNEKQLWVSTLKGLVRFNMRTEEVTVYTKSNGLITNQFNHSSAYKAPNGALYFGSLKGLIEFDPKAFDQVEAAPPTYITSLEINNQEIRPGETHSPLQKSILFVDSITLQHNQNNFSIAFVALDYASPKAIRYKYKMKGIDQSWNYLTTNRQAYFTDLAPGSYEFILRAMSATGSWTGEEKRLFIKIAPPFWRTGVAYLFYILLIATVIYLTVRYQLKRIERRNQLKLQRFTHEKEKEIYQAKIEFFTHIAHEIRTPLTLIAGPIEWLKQQFGHQKSVQKSLDIAQRNAQRLTALTSQLLDFRKTETKQFRLSFVNTDIRGILTDLIESFKQEAENNKIHIETILPSSAQMAFVDREAFLKISTNLLSNAIKYASEQVSIKMESIQSTDDFLTIQFVNDGKGIADELKDRIFEPFFRIKGTGKPGTGIGLSLALSLTQLHNGTLQLSSARPDQVIFELGLPIHQEFEFQLNSWKKLD